MDSVLRLSPARSTYYTPLSIATIGLCFVTGDVVDDIWWAFAFVLAVLIAALAFRAASAQINLRGAEYVDELRVARVIALSGSIITLVSAASNVSPRVTVAAVHIVACTLQLGMFFAAHWDDPKNDPSHARFNVIQLTLILSALLGGAAYSAGQYVRLDRLYVDNADVAGVALHAKVHHFLILAVTFYSLWFLTGLAWFRARRTKR